MSNISTVTAAASALSNLLLVSPQQTIGYQPTPSGASSLPPALLFHYEGEQSVTLQSDITDHYAEDNSALQDQIALPPIEITTNGYIGELNDIAPPALAAAEALAQKLTIIDAYTPELSATALIAYNDAFEAYQIAQNAVNSAVAAWSSVTGTGGESVINAQGISIQPNQNKQQVAFQQFYGYYISRMLFTVQTPWAIFQNMAIKSLVAVQDEVTNVITGFKVTFKMMRFASSIESFTLTSALQGRLASQSAGMTDLGVSTPASSISLSQGLSQMGVA